MKRSVAVLSTAVLLLLAGCSATPSRDEVTERFLIEYTDDEGLRDAMREAAEAIADSALDGRCGDDAYEAGLRSGADEQLAYAWRTTCLMYFEGDLSDAQIAETKRMIADRVVAG